MELPDCDFFLFGMGNRRKLLYRDGVLSDALSGEVTQRWDVAGERILLAECRVELITASGGRVLLTEDAHGFRIEDGHSTVSTVYKQPLLLPRFDSHEHAGLLRVLHHELLVNIVDGAPLPNLLVYDKPWHRDAAMVCMCLERTGNLDVVADWVLGLREVFDRNNGGHREPDNLGQTLYMISLVSDASHPLVPEVLKAAEEFRTGDHICGLSDFAEHPVYQTKWLKFGLRALGLDDSYEIPAVYDSYSPLFWMDYRDEHVEGAPFGEQGRELYPYLAWAEAHFHGWDPPWDLLGDGYPRTWEAEASQADYAGMERACPEAAARRICLPHTWHAAEVFLYLLDGAA